VLLSTDRVGTTAFEYDALNRRVMVRDQNLVDIDTQYDTISNNSPLLSEIDFQLGGSRLYAFGAAGHLEAVESEASVVSLTIDAAGRIGRFQRSMAGGSTLATADVAYDGRGFLREVTPLQTVIFQDGFETGDTSCWTSTVGDAGEPPGGACPPPPPDGPAVEALYDSQGTLHGNTHTPSGGTPVIEVVLYFSGRPVAQRTDDGTTVTWQLFTTDHLGTPIAGTDEAGALLWEGGLEPFGSEVETGTFLRLPGQWTDLAWQDAASGLNPFYNVHRWYEHGTGRYTRADPVMLTDPVAQQAYAYALSNPSRYSDPLGLLAQFCCRELNVPVLWASRRIRGLLDAPPNQWCVP
jgi:RHS repeat-associated protein